MLWLRSEDAAERAGHGKTLLAGERTRASMTRTEPKQCRRWGSLENAQAISPPPALPVCALRRLVRLPLARCPAISLCCHSRTSLVSVGGEKNKTTTQVTPMSPTPPCHTPGHTRGARSPPSHGARPLVVHRRAGQRSDRRGEHVGGGRDAASTGSSDFRNLSRASALLHNRLLLPMVRSRSQMRLPSLKRLSSSELCPYHRLPLQTSLPRLPLDVTAASLPASDAHPAPRPPSERPSPPQARRSAVPALSFLCQISADESASCASSCVFPRRRIRNRPPPRPRKAHASDAIPVAIKRSLTPVGFPVSAGQIVARRCLF